MLTKHSDAFFELVLGHAGRAAQNNSTGVFDLIKEEFAEIFHIHPAFGRVHHRYGGIQLSLSVFRVQHGTGNIAELADTGRLDQNAVRRIFVENLGKRLGEIADKTAANAAGVHFIDLNAGFFHKAAVNADLAEFVLNEDELLAVIGFLDHLLDERRLSGAEETGINVNFCHTGTPSSCIFY